MKIDTKLLKRLKFEKTHVPPEVSGADAPFEYWILDLKGFCLITNASDEIKRDSWKVYLFEADEFIIKDGKLLIQLVKLLRKIAK